MDPNLPPGAYYRTTPTRNNVEGDLGSPLLGSHYVGLTPEVSSLSGLQTRSVSAAATNQDLRSPEQQESSCAFAFGARSPMSVPAASASANQLYNSLDDAEAESGRYRAKVATSDQPESRPRDLLLDGAHPQNTLSRSSGERAASERENTFVSSAGSRNSVDDDSSNGDGNAVEESDEEFSLPPFLTFSDAVAAHADPVEVIKARMRALGTAILQITETALSETGASLEDSLKAEHKAGPVKKRRKKKSAAEAPATTAAKSERRKWTDRDGITASQAREPSNGRTSTRLRPAPPSRQSSTMRAGATAAPKAALKGATSGTSTPAEKRVCATRRPAKRSAMKEGKGSAESGTDVSSQSKIVPSAAEATDTPHRCDFFVPPPADVLAALKQAAFLSRYGDLLARRQGRVVADADAGEDTETASNDHQGETGEEEEDSCDRAPLYSASNAVAIDGAPGKTWGEVRRCQTSPRASERDAVFDLRPVPVSTLCGVNATDWTSLGPTVLDVKELSEGEYDALKDQLCRPEHAEATAPAVESREDDPNRCFHVLYLHRYDDRAGAGDLVCPTCSPDAMEDTSDYRNLHSCCDSVSHSSVGVAAFGKTYYRALFSGLREPAYTQTSRWPVLAELCVSATNERVCSYARRCVNDALHSLTATHRKHNTCHGDSLLQSTERSVSECSQTPTIDGCICRLDNWQMPSRQTHGISSQSARCPSLFSRPDRLSGALYSGTARFYYYAVVRNDASQAANDLHNCETSSAEDSAADKPDARGRSDSSFSPLGSSRPRPGTGQSMVPTVGSGTVVDVLLTSPARASPAPSSAAQGTVKRAWEADQDNTTRKLYVDAAVTSGAGVSFPLMENPKTTGVACCIEEHREEDVAAPPHPAALWQPELAQQHKQRETASWDLLEVVVANNYDAVEWLFSGAARRRQRRRLSTSSEDVAAAADSVVHGQQAVLSSRQRCQQVSLGSLPPVQSCSSAVRQGSEDNSAVMADSLLPANRRPQRLAAIFVSVGSDGDASV